MKRRTRTYSGTKDGAVTGRELTNRKLVRIVAADGAVLMYNNGILPLKEGSKVFLAGDGVIRPVKGGTGSGDVNEREVVDILTGLAGAFTVVNQAEVQSCIDDYADARAQYRAEVLKRIDEMEGGSDMGMFRLIGTTPLRDYQQISIDSTAISGSDAAIFVISRKAGEGADRYDKPGDYYLSERESQDLKDLSAVTDKIIVVLNLGGQIDMKEIRNNKSIAAVLNISQGGMEMGNSLADLVSGKVTPSGKLTDTWAENYGDFPSSEHFSHNDGNLEYDDFTDGIYVGYRYFDSFGVKPAYPFGFGLSYTEFTISEMSLALEGDKVVVVSAKVTNTGKAFSGKEVLQVYTACPQNASAKELKRLVGFAKTRLLAPGESETLRVSFESKAIASFEEDLSGWMVQKGDYIILAGTSSCDVAPAGILRVADDMIIEHVAHILPLTGDMKEITRPDALAHEALAKWTREAEALGIKAIEFTPAEEKKAPTGRRDLDRTACDIASRLTDEELTALLMGEITKGQDNLKNNELVPTGIFVPGAAGETTCLLEEKYDVPAISLADGPAGIRVLRTYDVDRKSGLIYSKDILSSLENGFFAQDYDNPDSDRYYMYATAIPIGTCLAQTFDMELIRQVGEMVGQEMTEFGISWWLAPGMNIHRNPLCGRNFEYYSEDPLVSGMAAAAMTQGVQSVPGVGTTIKHFCCNSQEDNRMHVSSNVSERALREIYLRGFEIAVKTAQPMCIMTSYNKINSIPAANSYDTCTVVARDEWGFEGIIMTDWTTTTAGESISHACAIAGNDLIMPGNQKDADDILAALRNGALPRAIAREAASRLIRVILQTLGMEDPVPYARQFKFKN